VQPMHLTGLAWLDIGQNLWPEQDIHGRPAPDPSVGSITRTKGLGEGSRNRNHDKITFSYVLRETAYGSIGSTQLGCLGNGPLPSCPSPR
jgi:hypothetical protein